jgi:ATP-binding protein involved in chromosome partitioning
MTIRVAVGQFHDLTDERLRFAQQIGATGLQMNNPTLPGDNRWEEKDVRALVTKVEEAGLKFEAIENVPTHFYHKAMMGLEGRPESADGKTMEPMRNHGAEVISIGFLVERDNAMIWRGPMATQALEQLLRQTNWGDLDYLIVDMPPGTGDIQLTLSQRVPLTGAVIVTTPQDIALIDARRGIKMFEKVGVPILGIVENMAVHVCSNCGHVEHIFGADGGKKMAAEFGMDYLGALPLALSIREQADSGRPTVVSEPDGETAGLYKAIARQLAATIAQRSKDFLSKLPTISISKTT